MVQIVTPVAAYAPQELWFWNALQLNQPYMNITTFGGSRSGIPTMRGQDIQVAYRAGQSWRAKYPDERTISLTMWLDGSGSAAGWPSTDARLAFNNNWQALRQAFFTRGANGSVQGQLKRNWFWSQGGSPQLVPSIAMAEIAGSMDLTMNGRTGSAFTVDLLLSDPYFYGAQVVQGISGSGSITNNGEGVAGEGWSSPVNSFSVACSAPCTVSNLTAGCSFTLASGPSYPVTVDILNYSVTDHSGNNVAAALTHTGSRLWIALLNGNNAINVSSGTATFTFNPPYI